MNILLKILNLNILEDKIINISQTQNSSFKTDDLQIYIRYILLHSS